MYRAYQSTPPIHEYIECMFKYAQRKSLVVIISDFLINIICYINCHLIT